MGKNVYDLEENHVGFAIHSFFLSDFVLDRMNELYPNYNNESAIIQISENDKNILYEDVLYYNISDYQSNINITIDSSISLSINFKYTNFYVRSFDNDNAEIILIIIILLFCIIDVVLFVFFLLYIRKQQTIELDKLQRQNSYISKMINYVNHEIRNPLNSILGMIDLTRMDFRKKNVDDNDPLMSNLNTAYNSCVLIDHIVNDVLDVRKLEDGKLDIYPEHLDLSEFCQQLHKLLISKIQEHINIKFTIECNVETMYVDKNRLTQILLNLITNSFKFTHDGFITLNIEEEDNYVKFTVIDTGCGITEEQTKYLFIPFSQVNQNKISRQVGYGLGLYLCRMLIELMNGKIFYKPNSDKFTRSGSIFWFVLSK